MLNIVHVVIEIYLKFFLEPRQVLNKSMKNHGHCAFIIEGFGVWRVWGLGVWEVGSPSCILEAESSLLKPQLQMAVGALMETS